MLVVALCAGSLLAAGACDSPAPRPLEGARLGGAFALTDQAGRRATDRDFAGKWRAVYFGYTFCPDVCPMDVQRLMKGYALFAKKDPARAAKLRPIFISIDPARDTPAALKQFVAAFDPGLTALTGSEAEIAAVAKRYGVAYQKQKASRPDEYLMSHSNYTTLFDPQGAPVAIIPTDQDAAAVAAEFVKWVR